jgi:hypothetical protein
MDVIVVSVDLHIRSAFLNANYTRYSPSSGGFRTTKTAHELTVKGYYDSRSYTVLKVELSKT